MKTVILLVLAIFLYENIFCDVDFLSKFHQSGYKIKDFRAELISYDKNYYEIAIIKTFKFNRTVTAQNLTMRFKKDLHDKLEILVQAYKFTSNEYRLFSMRFQVNFCKAFIANVAGALKILNCGNLTSCHFYKDVTYHVCNFVVHEEYLPPLIPNGQYMIEFQFLYLDKPISVCHTFAEVYTPIYYPKH